MLNNLRPIRRRARTNPPFSKQIHHHFENGHRVTINSPGHHAHNHSGTVTNDRNDYSLK